MVTYGDFYKKTILIEINIGHKICIDKFSRVKMKHITTNNNAEMSVIEHLDEMRHRLLLCLLLLIILTLLFFYYSDIILNYISQPFYKYTKLEKMHVFGITEAFTVKLKTSLILSIFVSIPFYLLQIWLYIKPAIEKINRTFFRINLFVGLLLFYIGIFFTFYILLPFTIEMLIKFTPSYIQNTQNISDYLNLIFYTVFLIGIVFELPIIINILTGIGIVNHKLLVKKRKYAIVGIWICAAIITPADILTQIIVAIPLMFLYEIAILFSLITFKRKLKKNNLD